MRNVPGKNSPSGNFFPIRIFKRMEDDFRTLFVCVSERERVKCAVSMRHRKLLYFTLRRVCRSIYNKHLYRDIRAVCVVNMVRRYNNNSRIVVFCRVALGWPHVLCPGVFVPFGQPWKLLINLIYPGKNDDVYNLYIVLASLIHLTRFALTHYHSLSRTAFVFSSINS